MRRLPLVLALAALFPSSALAQAAEETAPKHRSTRQIVEAAPDSAWRRPAPENLLLMEFGDGHQALIELAPQFAPRHVENIRALARGGFWDGTSIYRSQDNFVVQFGDADGDDPAKAKPFPTGVASKLPAEFERAATGLAFSALPDADGWAAQTGFVDGFAAARESAQGQAWLAHCYGALGAGRGNEADSSIGAELYVVSGQSPRQLDRNITLVGRVLEGMEQLSVIPRGPEPLGVHTEAERRVPIRHIRVVGDMPEAERPRIEVMRTDSPSFAEVVESRRNRRDGWYLRPAGHIDLCNISVPVRPAR
ncbi:peptidylprolyl isomerase [Luteimonas sp. e5]